MPQKVVKLIVNRLPSIINRQNSSLSICLGVLFFCTAFFAQGQPLQTPKLYSGATLLDKIVAKVDNQIILKSEVDLGTIQAKSSGERLKGNVECKVLEQLVLSKLMLAKAEIDTITVEDKIVDDQLDRRMQYMVSTVGGREKLEAYYKKTVEQLKAELRKQVKEQMVAQKVQDGITKDIKVTPAEVRRFFNAIPKDSLPYFSKEVEVGQIVMEVKQGKSSKARAKQKAKDLRDRVLAGENFEDLAKQYSEDPGSAASGGNLGFWGKGDMVPSYEAAALALKPGGISEVVESQFGFHIIQLIERKGGQYNSRHILVRPNPGEDDKTETLTRLDSIRTRILIDSLKFEQAAKKLSDDINTKDNGGYFIEQSTGTNRVALENLDPVVFFIIDTMDVGEITKPIPFRTADNKEAFRIIYFKAKHPPHEANLKDDYQKIYNACMLKKKQTALRNWFEKTRNEIFVTVDDEFDCELFKDGFE